jgi:hypothetical protein
MNGINCYIFEEELTKLINSSGLPVPTAYYIVENMALQLKVVYQELILAEQNKETSISENKQAVLNVSNENLAASISENTEENK